MIVYHDFTSMHVYVRHYVEPMHAFGGVVILMIDGYYRIEWFELHTPLAAVLGFLFGHAGGGE